MPLRRTSLALLAATVGVALGGLGSGFANAIKGAPAAELRTASPTRRRDVRGGLSSPNRRHGKRGWSVAEGKRRSIKRHNQRRHKRQSRG